MFPNARVVSNVFEAPFDAKGDFGDFEAAVQADLEHAGAVKH